MANSTIAPISYIQPLTTLRRVRRLPIEGIVLVNLGNTVHASDPVARADLRRPSFAAGCSARAGRFT